MQCTLMVIIQRYLFAEGLPNFFNINNLLINNFIMNRETYIEAGALD